MQKEEIELVQFCPVEASLEARHDLLARRIAEHAFGRDPYAVGETTVEGRADDEFGFATAVSWRDVKKDDASFDRLARFVAAGWTPMPPPPSVMQLISPNLLNALFSMGDVASDNVRSRSYASRRSRFQILRGLRQSSFSRCVRQFFRLSRLT